VPHSIEPAVTGRSKCRACGKPIAKGELRFGERLPNPFGDAGSETTHWYHVRCGAYRRPEAFAEVLETLGAVQDSNPGSELDDPAVLRRAVELGLAHRRVPRIDGVERASTGRARCRHCREAIARGEWRIPLVFVEEGMAASAGFVHASCSAGYFGTADVLDRLLHFGDDPDAGAELAAALSAPPD
jgi:hypothetical protein